MVVAALSTPTFHFHSVWGEPGVGKTALVNRALEAFLPDRSTYLYGAPSCSSRPNGRVSGFFLGGGVRVRVRVRGRGRVRVGVRVRVRVRVIVRVGAVLPERVGVGFGGDLI